MAEGMKKEIGTLFDDTNIETSEPRLCEDITSVYDILKGSSSDTALQATKKFISEKVSGLQGDLGTSILLGNVEIHWDKKRTQLLGYTEAREFPLALRFCEDVKKFLEIDSSIEGPHGIRID